MNQVKIIWTDPGNDGSIGRDGGFYHLPLVRTTKTMIILQNGIHIERWRKKDGTNIDFDEDYFGWVICPKDLKELNGQA